MAIQTDEMKIPRISINAFMDVYIDMAVPLIRSHCIVPACMLWGGPGIGKSHGVRALSKKIADIFDRLPQVHEIRALLLDPTDLRGVPVADLEHKKAIWLRPGMIPPDPAGDEYNEKVLYVIFADEITMAPEMIQNTLMEAVYDRRIGEHDLGPNVLIIAAGNRLTDRASVFQMPSPLKNRFLHYEIIPDFEQWKIDYAYEKVHPLIIGFLNNFPHYFNTFDPSMNQTAFATPRIWGEFVAPMLDHIALDNPHLDTLIGSAIGTPMKAEFMAFLKNSANMPSIQDILDGKPVHVPYEMPDVMYALGASLNAQVKKLKQKQMDNLVTFYIEVFDHAAPFGTKYISEFVDLIDVSKALLIPKLQKWFQDHREFMTAAISTQV